MWRSLLFLSAWEDCRLQSQHDGTQQYMETRHVSQVFFSTFLNLCAPSDLILKILLILKIIRCVLWSPKICFFEFWSSISPVSVHQAEYHLIQPFLYVSVMLIFKLRMHSHQSCLFCFNWTLGFLSSLIRLGSLNAQLNFDKDQKTKLLFLGSTSVWLNLGTTKPRFWLFLGCA